MHKNLFLLLIAITAGCSNYSSDLDCTQPIKSITIKPISAQTEAQSLIITNSMIQEAKKHFTVGDSEPVTLSGSVVFGDVYGLGSINSGLFLIEENSQQIGTIEIQPTWLFMEIPSDFSKKIIKIIKNCEKKP